MSVRNWGLINDGATFEGLMHTLVFFEDPKSTLFGRPGKDGGQDALSGDGTLVYQAKYNGDASASKAIRAAKQEAETIAKYKTTGHSREGQWKNVTQWRLVTNALFGPGDEKSWNEDVVPLFRELNLSIDYWARSELNTLVTKNPEVDRTYFQGHKRLFVPPPEARLELIRADRFLERENLTHFVGRTSDLKKFVAFSNSKARYLVLHGPGGVGKTRLMVEGAVEAASLEPWQVLWAKTHSLESSDDWFSALVPERPTLLLIDEPSGLDLLRIIDEQLERRGSKWKVIITVRTPKDPVVQYLKSAEIPDRKRQIEEIKPLSSADSRTLVNEMLMDGPLSKQDKSFLKKSADAISFSFDGYPVWQALAISLLEKVGHLKNFPKDSNSLAKLYLSEVTENQTKYSSDIVLSAMRWLALLGTVNRENSNTLSFLTEKIQLPSQDSTEDLVAWLVERKAILQRGAYNRLVEVKPDVIRDHLLKEWLIRDKGYSRNRLVSSPDAEALISDVLEQILTEPVGHRLKAILNALARGELLQALSGTKVDLLGKIVQKIETIIKVSGPDSLLRMLEALKEIARGRPEDILRISSFIRQRSDAIDPFLIWKTLQVLLESSKGANSERLQLELLKEMHCLHHSCPDNNDFVKRGFDELFPQLLSASGHFWAHYLGSVENFIRYLIEERLRTKDGSQDNYLQSILRASLTSERRYSYHDGKGQATSVTYNILPGHPFWRHQNNLLALLKDCLKDSSIDNGFRLLIWSCIAEARESSRKVSHRDRSGEVERRLLSELNWTLNFLRTKSPNLDELVAARALWTWELESCQEEIHALEELYISEPLIAEFGGVFCPQPHWCVLEGSKKDFVDKATSLSTPQELERLLERAKDFLLTSNQSVEEYMRLARRIGTSAPNHSFISELVESKLKSHQVEEYILAIAEGWLTEVRRQSQDSSLSLLQRLMSTCPNEEARITLLAGVFRDVNFSPPPLNADEAIFLRAHSSIFIKADRVICYLELITPTCLFQVDNFIKIANHLICHLTTQQQLSIALCTTAESLYRLVLQFPSQLAQKEIRDWIVDFYMRLRDPGRVPDNCFWHIKNLIKQLGPITFESFVEIIEQRCLLAQKIEKRINPFTINGLSQMNRISKLVEPIDLESEDETNIKELTWRLLKPIAEGHISHFEFQDLLRDIDPTGLFVPKITGAMISSLTSPCSEFFALARIAGSYSIGSQAWRIVAREALKKVEKLSEKESRRAYEAIVDEGLIFTTSSFGEVPPNFVKAFESAQKSAEKEEEAIFSDFWKWRTAITEKQLDDERQHAKENRGE